MVAAADGATVERRNCGIERSDNLDMRAQRVIVPILDRTSDLPFKCIPSLLDR